MVSAQPVGAVQRLVLPGYTAAWHASTIYARVNGYVGNWYNDIGDHVQAGQVLAIIETPDLDAQLAAARAQLQAGQAQVLVRKAEAEFAQTTYERWRDSPKGVVSEQEREEKRADYDSAVARLKAAEAQVALAQARVNQYAALAEFKKVTAPYDGVITRARHRHRQPGHRRQHLGDHAAVRDDAERSDAHLRRCAAERGRRPDQQQRAGAGADQRRRAARSTAARSRAPRRPSIRRRARCASRWTSPTRKDAFVPGMYVKVAFGLPPRGLVQVPAAALLFRASGPQVARVDAAGRISFRDVTIGRDDGSIVELASGVSPGDGWCSTSAARSSTVSGCGHSRATRRRRSPWRRPGNSERCHELACAPD